MKGLNMDSEGLTQTLSRQVTLYYVHNGLDSSFSDRSEVASTVVGM